LFRRAIGRNQAALQSTADWVWFTDCDVVFQQGCIDALNAALQSRQDALVFPCAEQRTDIYTDSDLVSQNALEKIELLQASDDLFISKTVTRATGPLQITHGDVARNNGYCRDVAFYQRPELIATRADLANYGAFGLSSIQWERVGFTSKGL